MRLWVQFAFLKALPSKSKVLRWFTEAKTLLLLQDRKPHCRNVCAAVPVSGRCSIAKGPCRSSACWWEPVWRRFFGGLEVTDWLASVGESFRKKAPWTIRAAPGVRLPNTGIPPWSWWWMCADTHCEWGDSGDLRGWNKPGWRREPKMCGLGSGEKRLSLVSTHREENGKRERCFCNGL